MYIVATKKVIIFIDLMLEKKNSIIVYIDALQIQRDYNQIEHTNIS